MDENKKDMGHSVFNMDNVNEVVKMSLAEAKKHALEILSKSTANAKNRAQIHKMIQSSKSTASLAMGITNHILAHPSEGLKTL